MLMLKKAEVSALLLIFFSVAIFSLPTSGKVFFEDDFEKDKIGGKPKKWDDPGEQVLKVIKDPEGESGNGLEQKGEANGEGLPIPLGTKPKDAGWTDYMVEWDWWWDADSWILLAWRYQGPNDYFYFMRNGKDQKFSWLIFKNNAQVVKVSEVWPTDLKKWYRFQLSVIGEEFILKGKERSDDTLFEKVKPIMDWKHGAYKQGPIGLFGAEPRVLWDNMMVYQPGTDPYAVESSNKLTDTWARIKSRN